MVKVKITTVSGFSGNKVTKYENVSEEKYKEMKNIAKEQSLRRSRGEDVAPLTISRYSGKMPEGKISKLKRKAKVFVKYLEKNHSKKNFRSTSNRNSSVRRPSFNDNVFGGGSLLGSSSLGGKRNSGFGEFRSPLLGEGKSSRSRNPFGSGIFKSPLLDNFGSSKRGRRRKEWWE